MAFAEDAILAFIFLCMVVGFFGIVRRIWLELHKVYFRLFEKSSVKKNGRKGVKRSNGVVKEKA